MLCAITGMKIRLRSFRGAFFSCISTTDCICCKLHRENDPWCDSDVWPWFANFDRNRSCNLNRLWRFGNRFSPAPSTVTHLFESQICRKWSIVSRKCIRKISTWRFLRYTRRARKFPHKILTLLNNKRRTERAVWRYSCLRAVLENFRSRRKWRTIREILIE